MRLTQKKIEEILLTILGEEHMPLINELAGKENISEFDLATKTKKDIKVVRKILYLLYNHNLVGFTRKKDKQKGWYIYYWTLLPDSIRFNYYKMKRDLLVRLKEQLEEEKKELFFVCPNKCVRLNFDQSMDFEFHCPECGELITQDDNGKKIKELEAKIIEIESEVKEMEDERKARRKVVKEKKKETKMKKKITAKKKAAKKTAERPVKKAAKDKPEVKKKKPIDKLSKKKIETISNKSKSSSKDKQENKKVKKKR